MDEECASCGINSDRASSNKCKCTATGASPLRCLLACPSLPPLILLPFLHPRPCRCGGRGQTIKHYCPSCKGARIVDTVSDLDLHIDRGMPEGEEIVFEGEADESPDLEAGDVVVRVRSKKEKGGFVRKDSNLYWKEPISVAEVRGPIGRLQTKMSFGRICLLAVL